MGVTSLTSWVHEGIITGTLINLNPKYGAVCKEHYKELLVKKKNKELGISLYR